MILYSSLLFQRIFARLQGTIEIMRIAAVFILLLLPAVAAAFMTEEDIANHQAVTHAWPIGDRIAYWAEQFVDTPYDPDPLGCYVRENAVVADDKVDCMYLTFRSVELALAKDPSEAIGIALDKRFRTRGIVQAGKVLNYADRFEYGEDMLDSGKWGKEITAEIGRTHGVRGSRKSGEVHIISGKSLISNTGKLRNGDIIFFVRDPQKRISDEIVGHIGIIKKEADNTYLIHAGGLKNKGGKVKKPPLTGYVRTMPFIGVRVSRFEPEAATQ